MIRFGRKSGICPEFSNFWSCPVTYEGLTYRNSEAAFQAQKTRDEDKKTKFIGVSGGQAKKLGRDVLLRFDWEAVKFGIMCDIVYQKFSQNDSLKRKLLSTGNEYIMENTSYWHDNTWGCCSCDRCSRKVSTNWLGLALMFTRSKLRGDDTCIVEVQFGDEKFTPDLYKIKDDEKFYELIDKINRYGI